jgi:hypothetical protein
MSDIFTIVSMDNFCGNFFRKCQITPLFSHSYFSIFLFAEIYINTFFS